ncbi:MAG: hypothetical protein ACK4F0_03870 [Candidatus Ratteibacteria bacterium]
MGKGKRKRYSYRLDEKIRDKIVKTNLNRYGISDFGDFFQPSWAESVRNPDIDLFQWHRYRL